MTTYVLHILDDDAMLDLTAEVIDVNISIILDVNDFTCLTLRNLLEIGRYVEYRDGIYHTSIVEFLSPQRRRYAPLRFSTAGLATAILTGFGHIPRNLTLHTVYRISPTQ